MNQKAILTKGIIASGKSWWAKEFLKQNKNFKRVNRDHIRFCLSDYQFNDENEKLVQKVWKHIVKEILESGYNLIVDEQNLNPKTRESNIKYIKEISPDIEIEIKNFPIMLEEAITRDSLREFKIGEKVLKRTWHKYKNELIEMIEESKPKVEYDPDLPDVVCFDVDGTLSFRNGRDPYDLTKVDQDLPNKLIFEQMNFHFLQGRKIFIFSGRENICFDQTTNWINKYKINPDICFDLCMRKEKDNRRDSIVKKEMYEKYIKGKYNLIAVYDDRPQVIKECWRELGIFVFDVGKGVDF